MRLSLAWQVIWAPAVAVLVAVLLLAAEARGRDYLALQVGAVNAVRETLDRSVARLTDRHVRTIRRANEAAQETRRENRVAILAWTSEHYLAEMERLVAETRAAFTAAFVPGADARLPLDKERLEAQLVRILEQAPAVATALDALLSAASSDESEAVSNATVELARADRAMHGLLTVAAGLVRRLSIWQLERALAAPPPVPRTAWLILAGWAPLALLLALRPLRRLSRLGQDAALPDSAGSPEERELLVRLRAVDAERQRLERDLGERAREAERAEKTSRRNEHELLLLRLTMENLLSSLRAAVVVTDAALVVKSVNRTARQRFGIDEQRLERPVDELPLRAAIATREPDASAELRRALGERTALRFEGLPYAAPDGEILIDLTVTPYLDEGGTARGLIFVADDVTEQVRTKSQLLAAERLAAVGRLSAQVAHEVRNPLSAIGLNAELLSEDFANELEEPRRSEAAKLLRAIAAEIERLTHVTEGYLQLTRLPRPSLAPINVNLVVSDLISMLREEMRAHDISVNLELASPAPHVLADPGQLRQALLNIVRNSREAMDHGGALTITTRQKDGEVELAVADTGEGIPAEVLPRIFEPFFTTKPAGTGLGLSLTQQIVAEHGGAIRAEARQPRGTLITMNLPSASSP
jgi:signal transduction histidine kinase